MAKKQASFAAMKNGETIPAQLADALNNDAYAAKVFVKMRPSCQAQYALRIGMAKDEAVLQSRLQSILAQIRKYGMRHGIT